MSRGPTQPRPAEPEIIPYRARVATAALMAVTIGVAAVGRLTGLGVDDPAVATVVETRTLTFADRPDGGLDVMSAEGETLAHLVIEGDSFAITAIRAAGGRVGAWDGPPRFSLELRREADGRFSLVDVADRRRVWLEGFGPASRAALTRFLPQG